MPPKKPSLDQVIAKDMPGWKIVASSARADASATPSVPAKADMVSPGLAAQQAKLGIFANPTAKKTKAKKGPEKHAEFVTVTPASQPDALQQFQKVVIVKDGKIIMRQG